MTQHRNVDFRSLHGFVALVVLLLCAAPLAAQTRYDETTDDTLRFESVVSDGLVEELHSALNAYRADLRSGQQVAVRPLTQQSAEIDLLTDRLRSRGYFNGQIEPEPSDDFGRLRYHVIPDRRFVIRQLDWDWPEPLTNVRLDAQSRLQAGQPLAARDVLNTRSAVQREIQNRACFLRVNVRYELSLDRTAASGTLRFYMDSSPQVSIREVRVEGTETVDADYARSLTGLSEGQCFQRPALDEARLNLYESNLFARVQEQVSEPDDNNQVAVTYQVQERFHRTLSLGGGYDTDSGFGVSSEWTHRNVSGRGEQLTLGAQLSQLSQAGYATYTIPPRRTNWPRVNLSTRLERTEFAELESLSWRQSLELEQSLWPDWTGTAGIDLRSSWQEQTDHSTQFEQWVALPLTVVRDTRNDPLNPTSGSRWLVGATPNYSLSGTQPGYTLLRTAWRGYWPQTERLTLALSADAANLVGLGQSLDFSSLGASERLYAGGGGSVRGWPYQEVPPEDGGRTRILASTEQRLRINENWGLVGFADAAWLSADPTLSAEDDAYGAGFGIRYFTSFAPLRADVASPLPNWGDQLSYYFSIGQAF